MKGWRKMSVDRPTAARAPEEIWLRNLEASVEEVFEVMLGCCPEPAPRPDHPVTAEFTALVRLAGEPCGMLAIVCDRQTAHCIARCVLGDLADSEEQVADALGKICSMVAQHFKSKLTSIDGRCMLSVPTVISGKHYTLRSLAAGQLLETCLLFGDFPIGVRLELHS